jgi:hypothetical protein
LQAFGCEPPILRLRSVARPKIRAGERGLNPYLAASLKLTPTFGNQTGRSGNSLKPGNEYGVAVIFLDIYRDRAAFFQPFFDLIEAYRQPLHPQLRLVIRVEPQAQTFPAEPGSNETPE